MSQINSNWSVVKLKSITSKIGSGATPRGGQNSYQSKGISLIRSLNVYDFSFSEKNLAFLDEKQAKELNNVIVSKNDILLNITGASVARCCMANAKFLPARVNQHVAIIRVRPELADSRFVLFSINSPYLKSKLLSLAQGGATREALTKTTIENFEIPLPPLPIQTRIAEILSAYDDLIENNQRRIKILEQMARALYREWFVDFRFPGYENAQFVDSPLGKIPEGWSCGVVNDLLALKSGFAFKSSTFEKSGKYGLATIKNVQDGAFIPLFTNRIHILPLKMPDYCMLQRGDILLSLTGNVGRTCLFYGEDCLLNQRVAKILPHNQENRTFVYICFRQNDFQKKLIQISNGVAQQNLSPIEAGQIKVILPEEKLLENFARICEPFIKSILILFEKTANLRRTRDLLLPRLLSGQLDVSTLRKEPLP
ncbi:hypothetical protein CKO12_00795 [Chromatium okenii]|uniref:restriction endonuclease subunit S n=1 Tax=Chromatium okenii TaxID=61644 RepID=UPI0019033C2F|nr:restriction endonuclease subunit S [Chromatium okenii]MBK1640440.1 hypothetical protein [Chromatium okenii]